MKLSKLLNNFWVQTVLSKSLCGPEAVEEWLSYERQIQIFSVLIEYLN